MFNHDEKLLVVSIGTFAFLAWYVFIFNGPLLGLDRGAPDPLAIEQKLVEQEVGELNSVSSSDRTLVIERELMETDLDDLDKELADIEQLLSF